MRLIKPNWQAPSYVSAFCTTREGGFSVGEYRGLNVGAHVGDDLDIVQKNRALLPNASKIAWLNQTHSNCVIRLEQSNKREGDAAIASTPKWHCAVMTADCVPILLFSRSRQEVAAIHAGWKGLVNGIIKNTVGSMNSEPDELVAWIGPAISANCYEVNSELAARFSQYTGAVSNLNEEQNRAHVNLPLIAQCQLAGFGVGSISQSNLCTYQNRKDFYSHRRATHQSQQATGRIVSVIGIR